VSEKPELSIVLSTADPFECWVGEIRFNRYLFAYISQDLGPDKLMVVFPDGPVASEDGMPLIRRVQLKSFVDALHQCASKLLNWIPTKVGDLQGCAIAEAKDPDLTTSGADLFWHGLYVLKVTREPNHEDSMVIIPNDEVPKHLLTRTLPLEGLLVALSMAESQLE